MRRLPQLSRKSALALATAAVVFLPAVLDAILVAPHAVFMDHRTRSSQVFLVNTGAVAEDVTLELRFGYPDSDSLGGVYVRWDVPDSAQSAAGWVRAFPRRTIVRPGERQAVRLLAQPPADLADGEYWSRLIVTSREIRPGAIVADSTVHAGVNVEIRTILSLSYRKGPVRTSATMTEFRPEHVGDTMAVWLGLHRDGNAAFLGTVDIEVRNQSGRVVGRERAPIAVYYAVRRRFAIELPTPVTPGIYTVIARVTTDRDDLDRANILRAAAIGDSAAVLVR